MTRFLRITRQARWLKHPDLEWLSQGELQSDALGDLQTRDNALSVYRVDGKKDAERVVVALAANRDNLANLDYAIFEDVDVASIDIEISQNEGETPDAEVNELHYDLANLTARRLVQLAQVISLGEHSRMPKKTVQVRLRRALLAGYLDKVRLKPHLLRSIQ